MAPPARGAGRGTSRNAPVSPVVRPAQSDSSSVLSARRMAALPSIRRVKNPVAVLTCVIRPSVGRQRSDEARYRVR